MWLMCMSDKNTFYVQLIQSRPLWKINTSLSKIIAFERFQKMSVYQRNIRNVHMLLTFILIF